MLYVKKEKDSVTMIFDNSLTEEQKKDFIFFDTIPPFEEKEGFARLLVFKNEELHWEYLPINKE